MDSPSNGSANYKLQAIKESLKNGSITKEQLEKELGKIVDGADGLNINQYFEDKKEKSKLPIAIKKQNIFSKLREIIANKRENSKYIDNSIAAKDIAKVHEEKSKKEKFKSGIEVGDTSNIEVPEQKNIQTVERKEKVPTDIERG